MYEYKPGLSLVGLCSRRPRDPLHGATGSVTSFCLYQRVSVGTVEDRRTKGCSSWLSVSRRKASRFLFVSEFQQVSMYANSVSPNSYSVHHKTNTMWKFIFRMDTHSSLRTLAVANG